MSRCRISKPSKVRRLAELTGRPIIGGLARGGSDHAVIAYEADGTSWIVSKHGEVEKSQYKSTIPVPVPEPSVR